jgi:hypothetical protein
MTELPDAYTALAKPDLFVAFTAQLKKDFANCGLNSDFISSLLGDYELILEVIAGEIKTVNKNRPNKISELLYRVDISESQLKKLTLQKPGAAFETIVAELIIKRELQKVVIHQLYRS